MKKKNVAKKVVRKVKVTKKEVVSVHKENEPSYVVQVNDPKMLRKDVLEALREIILFMQGYEKFRKIQEDKVALFNILKADVRDLNTIVDTKLKKYMPKGNLKVVKQEKPAEEQQVKVVPINQAPKVVVEKYHDEPVQMVNNDLEDLENQLKSIEDQLRNIK